MSLLASHRAGGGDGVGGKIKKKRKGEKRLEIGLGVVVAVLGILDQFGKV